MRHSFPLLTVVTIFLGSLLAGSQAKAIDVCGNGFCANDGIETCSTCPSDCGPCEPVCGNFTCEFSEDSSTCPTDCPSGDYSPDDNYCVVDVKGEISSLGWRDGTVVRYHDDPNTSSLTVTNEDGLTGPNPITFFELWNELDSRDQSACHVQGIAKFPAGAPVDFTFDWNRVGGVENALLDFIAECPDVGEPDAAQFAASLMTKPASTTRVRYGKLFGDEFTENHPGGMQAIGKYLLVGADAGGTTAQIYVWDFGDPQNPVVVNSFEHQGTTAAALAIGRLADNRYLLFIAADSGSTLNVYRSSGTSLSTTGWQFLGQFKGGTNWAGLSDPDYNYNNLAMLKECGTNDLYLAGLTNNHFPGCGGNFDDCDISVIDLHKVTKDGNVVGPYGLEPQFVEELDNPCDCFLCTDICPNFAAGGTLQPRPDGGIDAFATEHWNDGSDLDILEW